MRPQSGPFPRRGWRRPRLARLYVPLERALRQGSRARSLQPGARRQAMPAYEFPGAHAAPAGGLQLVYGERRLPACNGQDIALREHDTRLAESVHDARAPNLDWLLGEASHRSGRRPERTHGALKLDRGPLPTQLRLGLVDFVRVGHAIGALRLRAGAP